MKVPLLVLVASAALAQARFEVASVKASSSPLELRTKGLTPPRPSNDAFRFHTYGSLTILIRAAYELAHYQTLSGPVWMDTTWFEITANMPEGSMRTQAPAMLAALLADRFGLVVRKESTERPVYILVAGKEGVKLKVATDGDLTSEHPFPNGSGGRIVAYETYAGPDGWQTYSLRNRDDRTMIFDAARITMRQFAAVLARQVDLPVVDRTGLNGAYEISLLVPHGPNGASPMARSGIPAPVGASDPVGGLDIFKSIEKLGLRLEKSRFPIESVFVEHLEKAPTDN